MKEWFNKFIWLLAGALIMHLYYGWALPYCKVVF